MEKVLKKAVTSEHLVLELKAKPLWPAYVFLNSCVHVSSPSCRVRINLEYLGMGW